MRIISLLSYILLAGAVTTLAQTTTTPAGNCVSEVIRFDPSRIYNAQGSSNPGNIDPEKYDFILDYGASNLRTTTDGILLGLSQSADGTTAGQGVRLTSTRRYLHARISLLIQAPPSSGIVTSFITLSEQKDEIDWELIAGKAETNVFYRGIKEYGVHGSSHGMDVSSAPYKYTIDWRRTRLDFLINDQVVKSHSTYDTSPMTPAGEYWYPNTPSKIQLGIWDAGASDLQGVRDWVGGSVNWNAASGGEFSAYMGNLTIQCYDAAGMIVSEWPHGSKAVSSSAPVVTRSPHILGHGVSSVLSLILVSAFLF